MDSFVLRKGGWDEVGAGLRMLPSPSALVGTSTWDSLISMAGNSIGVECWTIDFKCLRDDG